MKKLSKPMKEQKNIQLYAVDVFTSFCTLTDALCLYKYGSCDIITYDPCMDRPASSWSNCDYFTPAK